MGDGLFDLLYFYGLGSHVDMHWDDPRDARWLGDLASFSRLIFFDRRGTGASDGLDRSATTAREEWADDARAVLDAAGSDRAAIFAALDAGPIAILFAALQRERVSALVLASTSARYLMADDYPIGASQDTADALVEMVGSLRGTEDLTRFVNPGLAVDAEFVHGNARRLRAAATPRTAAAQYRYILESVDVRGILHLVRAPTLVLHTRQNPIVPIAHGRYLAKQIPGAKFVEVPGLGIAFDDGESGLALDEIAEFLTGERRVVAVDRVRTTVLFTDIVASTERLASLEDKRWRALLDAD